jgi:inositol transport system permease protein
MNRTSFRGLATALMRKYSIFVILAFVFVICSFISRNFLSTENISNISKQIAIVTIVAFGQTMLIISGMLDLAVGSTVALSGLLAVFFYKSTGLLVPSLFVGMAVGMMVNLVSATAVTRFRIPPFIATLGMLTSVRGVALLTTNGQNIYQIDRFVIWGQTKMLGFPTPVWFMAGAGLVTWYLLNHTKFGRHLYAIGGNEEAARAAGIKVNPVKIKAYLVSGLFTGLAGVLYMARVNAGLPNAAIGFELDTLSVTVIGGTSLAGGIGSASGTLAGSFIVGFIGNIMNLTAVPSYIQQVVRGLIIMVAVGYDVFSKESQESASSEGRKRPEERKGA